MALTTSTPRVTETRQIAARIPLALFDQLERVAKAHDRTISYEVRRAIKVIVEAHNRKDAACSP